MQNDKVLLPTQLYFMGGLAKKMHTKLLMIYSRTETFPPSQMKTVQFCNCLCYNHFLKLFSLLITFHIICTHFFWKKQHWQSMLLLREILAVLLSFSHSHEFFLYVMLELLHVMVQCSEH